MNRADFVKLFAKKFEIPQTMAREMCYAVFETLSEQLDESTENIHIYGLGTFKHEKRKGKVLRHPKTGELMTIPERDIITFKRAEIKPQEEGEDEEEEEEDAEIRLHLAGGDERP